jgi:hypothetical protein
MADADKKKIEEALSQLARQVRLSILLQMVVPDAPQNLIGDNAYDSDRLDTELRSYGIEVIAPHRRNRRNSTQDERRPKTSRRALTETCNSDQFELTHTIKAESVSIESYYVFQNSSRLE